MDLLKFNTGGYPATTNTLDFLQNASKLFNAFGNLAAPLAIISGCTLTGTQVSNGVVFINGELLPFVGGTLDTNVIILESSTNGTYEDGISKPISATRTAGFGLGTGYAWADFVRVENLDTLSKSKKSIEERLDKLEKSLPKGLVAIWGKPADAIPTGWVEHSDLAGFTPVGLKLGDSDFGTLDTTLGEKKHLLSIAEMPKHAHRQGSESLYNDYDGGTLVGNRVLPGGDRPAYRNQYSEELGGNEAHNNIQPSRIVQFIRFVGF